MVVKTIIWHNPKCSKSQQALELVIKGNVFPKIRLYLQEPPSKNEIREVLSILKLNAIDFVRKKKSQNINPYIQTNEELLIEILTKNPILIERPIVIQGKKALIARPPSLIKSLIED
ncbi:MAG: arsenate reductase (glutaredoxin) [Rhodobacteraceae bacterium]|nr:arsenate reductase (glutaredoxin) [Paracoccaceae bacterium]